MISDENGEDVVGGYLAELYEESKQSDDAKLHLMFLQNLRTRKPTPLGGDDSEFGVGVPLWGVVSRHLSVFRSFFCLIVDIGIANIWSLRYNMGMKYFRRTKAMVSPLNDLFVFYPRVPQEDISS